MTGLLFGLIASGVCLVLVGLACAFVWLVTDAGDDGTPYRPDIQPPAAQPGPPVVIR